MLDINSIATNRLPDRTSMVNTTVGASAIVPEVLNWDNYEHWSVRVKTYLLAEGLWKVVEPTASELEHDEDWSRENAKALHAIHISCGSDVFLLISDTDRAKVAWDKLKETFVLYQGNTENRIDGGRARHVEGADGYEAFFKDLESKNWNAVKDFLNRNPDAVRIGDPNYYSLTVLHRVAMVPNLQLVEEMMQYVMKEEDLETKDWFGQTPFCYAVRNGTIETAACLLRKNKRLVTSVIFYPPNLQVKPVVSAVWYSKWEMTQYLYSVTPPEALNDANGATLIGCCIAKKRFDIAWDLLQRYPNLATTKDFYEDFPINILAGIRSAFLSGTPLRFWQRWIYESIHDDFTIPGTFRNVENDEKNQRDFICSASKCHRQTGGHANLSFWHHISSNCKAIWGIFQGLVMILLKLLGIFNSIYKIKLIHAQALQFLHCMSEVALNQHKTQLHDSVVQRAIFRAVERGHFEFVKALVARNKGIIEMYDKKRRLLFHFAIECRQEKVYSLLFEAEYEGYIQKILRATDGLENGLLHAVGNISPSTQFNHIRDAALQMQRELQWFKEVESIVPSELHENLNMVNKMTGRELFTKNHEELVKEGEKSMKETATSCTVVGALIITIMFAASFTVAGGNDGNTGLPMFLDDKLFVVFIVSDALSLFSSTTSVMIFLGILTSRYAEDDFLMSLPSKMMAGLLTLFFSIATMMITFSSTLIIMLYHKYSWIVVPIILLACVPITSFIWMQFPLLVEICISTYGLGIFGKKPVVEPQRSRLRGFYTRMKARAFTHLTLKSIV